MAKYKLLQDFLARQDAVRIIQTFEEIERLIGGDLPPSARGNDARAWQNEGDVATHPQARAWRSAGYKVHHVDPGRELVTFERLTTSD